jgi:hypothetical protein
MKTKEFMFEDKKPKIHKQRDPNWRTMQAKATSGAGGSHKDQKRAEKQGDVKHKKDLIPIESISEAPGDIRDRLSQMRAGTQDKLTAIKSRSRDTLDKMRSRSSVANPSQIPSLFKKPEDDRSPKVGARIEWGQFRSPERRSGMITKVRGHVVTVRTDQGEEEIDLRNKSLTYNIMSNDSSQNMGEASGDTKFRKNDEIMFGYKDDPEGLKKGTVVKVSDTDPSKLLVKTDKGTEVIDVSPKATGPKFDKNIGKPLPGAIEQGDKKEFYAFRLTDIDPGSDDDVYQQKTPFGSVSYTGARAQAMRNIDKYGNPYGPDGNDIKGRDPRTAELHKQQDLEWDREREQHKGSYVVPSTRYSGDSDADFDDDEGDAFSNVVNFYKNASPEQRKEIEDHPDLKSNPEQLKKLKQAAGVEETVAASPRLQRAHDEERKRRGLPHPDEYLRMIEKKKKEIADMRAQDLEDEKKKGVSEGDEPDEAYMNRVISDLHKDARGVRPDHEWGNWWMSLSYKEKAKIFNDMVDELGESIEEATGDRPFDDMMRQIKKGTKKQATADRRERERQSREQARAAFGPSPADRLSIRSDKGVAEGDYPDGSSLKTPSSQEWQTEYEKAQMAVKNAKTQQEYEAASDRAGRIKDLLASKGIKVGPVLEKGGVTEVSDFGEPQEILEDVLRVLEREVEWPLTDVMDRSEVKQLLAPVVRAVNDKLMKIMRMGEARDDDWGSMSHGEFKRRELDYELGHETNNVSIDINGKPWKVLQGESENPRRALARAEKIAAGIKRNAVAKGRPEPRVDVYVTGAPATE